MSGIVQTVTSTVVTLTGIVALTLLTIFADVDSQVTVPAIAGLAGVGAGAAIQRVTNGNGAKR